MVLRRGVASAARDAANTTAQPEAIASNVRSATRRRVSNDEPRRSGEGRHRTPINPTNLYTAMSKPEPEPEPVWTPWEHDVCDNCGGPAEILTTAEEDFAFDGDSARCTECEMTGSICCDSESPAVIMWHDDPDCECEWCVKNNVSNKSKQNQ